MTKPKPKAKPKVEQAKVVDLSSREWQLLRGMFMESIARCDRMAQRAEERLLYSLATELNLTTYALGDLLDRIQQTLGDKRSLRMQWTVEKGKAK